MMLPADTHVHSEWSWDTGGPSSDAAGRMAQTCARAVSIGLPALVFTEHLDFESWRADPEDVMPHQESLLGADGFLRPTPLDIAGYLDAVDRCRHAFPGLGILTGVEYGQPHLFDAQAALLLDLGDLDRVNGSLHTLQFDGYRAEPSTLYRRMPAAEVMEAYLEEIPRMIAGSDTFQVFTHIDYAVRAWPTDTEGAFDPRRFEEGFRAGMRAIAAGGRALEINTSLLRPWIPQWWSEEGGRAVSFGSDAHVPGDLARNFAEAVAMVEYFGFRRGPRSEDLWTR